MDRCSFAAVCIVCLLWLSGCGGGSGSSTAAPPPANIAPQPSFSASTKTGYAPLPVIFDASASFDQDGTITSYVWDTGTGDQYTGLEVIEHVYDEIGSHTVTLTVTDDDGATTSRSMTIDVYVQAAGLWSGSTSDSGLRDQDTYLYAQLSSDNRIFIDEWDLEQTTLLTSYSGVYFNPGSIPNPTDVGSDLLAQIPGLVEPTAASFPDGSYLTTAELYLTIVPQSTATGSMIYWDLDQSGIAPSAMVYLFYDEELSNRPSSLSSVAGYWSDQSDGVLEEMVVEEDGNFLLTDSLGCLISGTIEILRPDLNEYAIEYDLSCPPGANDAGDGRRKGIAYINDRDYADTWFIWQITFQEGPFAGRKGGGSVSRPRSAGQLDELSYGNSMKPTYEAGTSNTGPYGSKYMVP